jgi:hypothetical protein
MRHRLEYEEKKNKRKNEPWKVKETNEDYKAKNGDMHAKRRVNSRARLRRRKKKRTTRQEEEKEIE